LIYKKLRYISINSLDMRIKLQPYAILRVKSDFIRIASYWKSDCFRLGTDWLVKCKAVRPRLAIPGKGVVRYQVKTRNGQG